MLAAYAGGRTDTVIMRLVDVFMAIPAFGGYGRSKVNASTGGKTPMSSVFLSLITVFCVLFLLPYFYYIPVSRLIQSHISSHNHIY